jgi:hypothetical protein
MRRKSLAFALLSCVTSAEHAAAIEGDLIEQRAIHGKLWFALHVIRTTFALFGLAVTQAPFRIAMLSAAAAAASVLMCLLVGRAFFGPEALIPTPLFGFATIVACAILIGVALARVAGALGVRAAAATSLLLLVMFSVNQMLGGFEQSWSTEVGSSGSLDAFGSFAVKLVLGLCVYPGPLLIASACAHVRRL